MAFVRQPGSTIERVLSCDKALPPEEQTIVVVKVLDLGGWTRWTEESARLKQIGQLPRTLRRLIGMGLVEVRNLRVREPDGSSTDFQLEKSGDELTDRCMALLWPFRDELLSMIESAQVFSEDAAKN